MGAFTSCLDKPITDKFSSDEANEKLNCGASSMQGWRDTQEDAHNCIIDYDTDTAYFAVYDGHGGHEVAQYCSENLPNFLKDLDDYKSGDIKKALVDAFLKFDESITTKKVTDYLETIREEYCDKRIDENEEPLKSLCKEVIELQSKKIDSLPNNSSTSSDDGEIIDSDDGVIISRDDGKVVSSDDGEVVSSDGEVVSSSSIVQDGGLNVKSNKSSDGGLKSQESNDADNKINIEVKVDSPDSSGDTRELCTPSDITVEKKSADHNGKTCIEVCESSKPDVSSSSTTAHNVDAEKGKASTKTNGVLTKKPTPRKLNRNTSQPESSLLVEKEHTVEEKIDDIATNKEISAADGNDSPQKSTTTSSKKATPPLENEKVEDEKDESAEGPTDETSEDEDDDEADETINTDDDSEEDSSIDEEDEESEEGRMKMYGFLKNMKRGPGLDSGSTAVVAVLKGNTLYVANAGDSRCVVCREGRAIKMSLDHKPTNKLESTRIKNAGGYICDAEGRINGGLNLSRAIGDHAYKQNKELSEREQLIIALPDVKTLTIKPGEDEFMILACDGIWNCLGSQEVVDFIKPRMEEHRGKLSRICEELFDHCLTPRLIDGEGYDNMTAIIVEFKTNSLKRPLSEQDDAEQCKKIKNDEAEASA